MATCTARLTAALLDRASRLMDRLPESTIVESVDFDPSAKIPLSVKIDLMGSPWPFPNAFTRQSLGNGTDRLSSSTGGVEFYTLLGTGFSKVASPQVS